MSRKTGDVARVYRWAYRRTREILATTPKVGPTGVHDQLEREMAARTSRVHGEGEPQQVPGPERIQQWLRQMRSEDTSGAWSIRTADPEDARVVLMALREAVAWFRPFEAGDILLSASVACWVAKLGRAVPDLCEPERLPVLVGLAREYAAAENDAAIEDLNLFVSFAPWTDDAAAYLRAADARVIDPARLASGTYLPSNLGRPLLDRTIAHWMDESAMARKAGADR